MQLIIKILFFIVLWIVIFSFLTFYISIKPRKIVTDADPSDFGLEYEEIGFKSADGLNLSGWLIPNKRTKKAIIVMHGYPADKANLLGIGQFLAKDFNVFLFDFRSFGKSHGKYTTAGYLEKNDLLGAIGFLQDRGLNEIGLYGFSLGGSVALMTRHDNIKAIVADSAYAKLSNMVKRMYGIFSVFKYPLFYLTKIYGILLLGINIADVSPVDSIRDADIPILLIHAGKDSQIPVSESYILHEANKKAQLWVIKNADHGMTHSINEIEYEKRVIGFFKENIR
jgi:hypothetical protein